MDCAPTAYEYISGKDRKLISREISEEEYQKGGIATDHFITLLRQFGHTVSPVCLPGHEEKFDHIAQTVSEDNFKNTLKSVPAILLVERPSICGPRYHDFAAIGVYKLGIDPAASPLTPLGGLLIDPGVGRCCRPQKGCSYCGAFLFENRTPEDCVQDLKHMSERYRGQEIAARAYAIWEQEGRPHGRDEDHWRLAEQQFDPR